MPVRRRVVSGASPARVVHLGDAALLQPFMAAGLELVAQGAQALTTSCGFLVRWQAALQAAVRDAVGEATRSADLFAGLGTFAFDLPGQVLAVEGARDAILALQAAANRSGRLVKALHRDLFRRPLTAAELGAFEAVVLDPPRAGAKEQVAELAASSVARIAYVSCNPATFARDAAMLVAGGYRLDWVQPVGQFRWSTHVELAAAFQKG